MALRLLLKKEEKIDLSKYMVEIEFGERPPYLEEYIKRVREKLGEPMMVDKLSGEMKKWREFNIIYPVGGGVFIHVYSPKDEMGGYKKYNVIEPPKPHPRLLRLIEEVLAEHISSKFVPRSSEEKKAYLLYLLDKILAPTGNVDYENVKPKRGKIPVRREDIDYIYEPSADRIMDSLIPLHLNIQMWRILLESNAAEQAARMTAMEAATDNAQEMIENLTLLYNRTRQQAITKELTEIVGGAEALK